MSLSTDKKSLVYKLQTQLFNFPKKGVRRWKMKACLAGAFFSVGTFLVLSGAIPFLGLMIILFAFGPCFMMCLDSFFDNGATEERKTKFLSSVQKFLEDNPHLSPYFEQVVHLTLHNKPYLMILLQIETTLDALQGERDIVFLDEKDWAAFKKEMTSEIAEQKRLAKEETLGENQRLGREILNISPNDADAPVQSFSGSAPTSSSHHVAQVEAPETEHLDVELISAGSIWRH